MGQHYQQYFELFVRQVQLMIYYLKDQRQPAIALKPGAIIILLQVLK